MIRSATPELDEIAVYRESADRQHVVDGQTVFQAVHSA
jgi:hypothetical protein